MALVPRSNITVGNLPLTRKQRSATSEHSSPVVHKYPSQRLTLRPVQKIIPPGPPRIIRSAIPKCRLATPLPFFEYPHNLNRISFRPPKARFPGGNAARIQFVRSNANPPDKFRFSVTLSGRTPIRRRKPLLSPQNNKKSESGAI